MENKKNYVDGIDVSACEHYRAEIETKMPYGEYEIQKDKCHYSGIEIIQNCKGNKGCIYKQLKRLQAENKELSESIKRLKHMAKAAALGREKYRTTLQEIREIAKKEYYTVEPDARYITDKIITKINEVIGAE
jgi:SMC interacting uncharacterized protein involved in chromosome segregation